MLVIRTLDIAREFIAKNLGEGVGIVIDGKDKDMEIIDNVNNVVTVDGVKVTDEFFSSQDVYIYDCYRFDKRDDVVVSNEE